MEQVTTIEQIQEAVRREPELRVRGGGSKPALSRGATLALDGLSGMLEYDPGEYTFTAWAGTSVKTIAELLDRHGQGLPFDPPLVGRGATLGGTVASGLSGSGRWRYGGVRDFLVGCRLVNGEGRLVRGGGKVVKNAAGFDVPKLMVGSLGRFGILVELTFKVFPQPAAWATLAADLPDLPAALEAMASLAMAPLELACLDLAPPARLWLRLGGSAEAMPARVERLRRLLAPAAVEQVDDEAAVWRAVSEFTWIPPGHGLVKVPLAPRQIPDLERQLAADMPRRYAVGGNVAWLAWPAARSPAELEAILGRLNCSALAITGDWSDPRLGPREGEPFARRLLGAFDPRGKLQTVSRAGEG